MLTSVNESISKSALRSDALKLRDALSKTFRQNASCKVAHWPLGIVAGTVVSGFWPIRSELDVRPLMQILLDTGSRICLPAIIDKQTIEFREYSSDTEMQEMGFGTKGPPDSAHVLNPSVMLVPLSAFDARGHRIGYGAGYYDRAIAQLRAAGISPRVIGVGFDCQEVDYVPNEPHDVRLTEVLTESGLRVFPMA